MSSRKRQKTDDDDGPSASRLSRKHPPRPPMASRLLSLPDEQLLRSILHFSSPPPSSSDHGHHGWEWACVVGRTCKTFQRIVRNFAPKSIYLSDFGKYQSLYRPEGTTVDCRAKLLESLGRRGCWMAQRLEDLHVNWSSIIRRYETGTINSFSARPDNRVASAIRSLLVSKESLPQLSWLDVNLTSDFVDGDELGISGDVLRSIPDALPKLTKLCLASCFQLPYDEWGDVIEEIVHQYQKGFQSLLRNLQCPLESLSLQNVGGWLTDSLLEECISHFGSSLTCLELFLEDEGPDAGLMAIARNCKNLTTLGLGNTLMTPPCLLAILQANRGLQNVGLTSNSRLRGAETVEMISRHCPNLKALRQHGDFHHDDIWKHGNRDDLARIFNRIDTIAVNFFLRESHVGRSSDFMQFVCRCGIREVECDRSAFDDPKTKERLKKLQSEFSDLVLTEQPYTRFISGSDCNCSYTDTKKELNDES